VLHATASSWVEIRSRDDRRVFSRLMRAGESYDVPATPGLTLTTGNAGGLTIDVDGKALPPLGSTGDVRRDVALNADALLKGAGKAP
jgi:cytoskeleton protein RodZ